MKQKLPEEKYLYKNLYLSKTRKTIILSNSWAKFSLIRLLIAKFLDKKFVNSLDLQIMTLSIDSRDWGKNPIFILNSLMLFALPIFFYYRSNTKSIVERNNFTLKKAQKHNYVSKNYIGIYKKSFLNFNKNLENSFQNTLKNKKEKLSRYEFFNIPTHFTNQMFLEEKNKLIHNSKILTKKVNKNINIIDSSSYITKIVKRNLKFSNLGQFQNSYTDNSNFHYINKLLYLKYRVNLKSVFLKQTFSKKYLSSAKHGGKFYSDFPIKLLTTNYVINNLFSEQEIRKVKPNFFLFEPLVIDEFIQNTISTKTFSKFFKDLKKTHKLKNNIKSDDLEIISCKQRKYHSNFLDNSFLALNFSYNIIYKNYPFNKESLFEVKKKYNRIFVKNWNLSPFFSKLKKNFSLISCIQSKENLLIKTNKLDIVIDQSDTFEKNLDFIRKILLMFRKNSNMHGKKNESIWSKNYYSIYYNKLSNKTLRLKILDFRKIYQNNIFHKYSISCTRFFSKSFIYNFKNNKYPKLSFDIYHWLYEIEDLSETLDPSNFLIKLNLIGNFKECFQNPSIENINNSNVKSKKLLTLIKNFKLSDTNLKNSVEDLWIYDLINNKIILDSLNIFSTQNHILWNWVKNKKIYLNSNYKIYSDNDLINFGSNYKNIFLFNGENNIEKNRIIYSLLLKNLLKYKRFTKIFVEKRPLFLKREISQVIQLKLNKFSILKLFSNKFNKRIFLSFYNTYRKVSEQTKFYLPTQSSKISFLERKETELETIFTNKELRKIKIRAQILANSNNMKIKEYSNILQLESFTRRVEINNLIFQSLNKIYFSLTLEYSKLLDFGNEIEKKILKKKNEVDKKFNQIEIFHCLKKDISIKNNSYTDWFFTSEWWEYNFHIFEMGLQKRFIIIGSYFQYFINSNIKFIRKGLANLYRKRKDLYTSNSRWNRRLFFDYKEKNILNFLWSDLHLINNFNNLHWAIASLIAFVFLCYQNYFSILIGSDSFDLWKHFENIKYLTDISRALYFTELLHRNKAQLNKTENLLISFFSNLKHYAKNIWFYLLTKRNLNNLLINNKSLDLSRRKRNLLVQSLIKPSRIQDYGFQSYFQPKTWNSPLFGYQRNPQQGLSYILFLSEMLKKKLLNDSFHLGNKWIFFASLQKIISSQTLQQTEKFNPKFQKIPLSLQLGLSCSKGILLIGPIESGRSYLIKNLASDCSVPLFGISINKLMYNKPDVITESWMNILIESLRRLNLTLDLAKGMSPCIIWIRNIHELDVNRSTQNIESDPTFLLGILLKHFQTNSLKTRTKNNIIMIGPTHIPRKIDPSLISPDRLDRVLNIRFLKTSQRKNQFTMLLNNNNLQLNKNLSYLKEFGYRTLGYNIRDLAAPTNEVSLISLTKNKSLVSDNIIQLAFHRQIFGFSHTNNKSNYKQNFTILLYKIGRAIIQNIMIEGSTTNPLNISNYLWKRKFYYLSKWYSEPSVNDSIIKESTILVHILVCLAGVAARDSWFLLEKESHTSISLEKSIENDLDLAFSILETFSSDFPWLETCETQFNNYEKKEPKIFLTKNVLTIMRSGIFAIARKSIINTQTDSQYESLISRNKIINQKIYEFNNTAWSPRFWRLNFSRSNLFNWIKRSSDFESFHTLEFSEKNLKRENEYDQIINKKKDQLFYERILPRVRKRNVEELESQFENILLEEQFEILGFFESSTQYQMEYLLDNQPKLFVGKRILWDPKGSFYRNRHFVFSRREFFVDEEMLRRLYITYGVRREREQSLSSNRIKRFFICRGYNKDLINNLSIRWWNQLPIDEKQNIYTLKRIEKIAIRLKRPQIFTPVYLYQRWLIENIPEKFSRLDLLTHRDRWIKINKLLLNDSFIYNILLESYQYLFEFFSSNKILLTQMTKTLLKKRWIFQNEILDMVGNIKKRNVSNRKK